jgi:hypothetical protein
MFCRSAARPGNAVANIKHPSNSRTAKQAGFVAENMKAFFFIDGFR